MKLNRTGISYVGIKKLSKVVVSGEEDTDMGGNKIDAAQIQIQLHMAHVLLSKFINPDREKEVLE